MAVWTDAHHTSFDEQYHVLVEMAASNARTVSGFDCPAGSLRETGDLEIIRLTPQKVGINPQNKGGQMMSGQIGNHYSFISVNNWGSYH